MLFYPMRLILLFPFLATAACLSAQIGGQGVYEFLNLQPVPRIAALGGNALATPDSSDLSLAVQNPSLLNRTMHNHATVNIVKFVSDIQAGYVAYARDFEKAGTFALGIQYLNYGNFPRTTPDGQSLGVASAGDYSFNLSYGKQLGPWSYGGTIKVINSNLDVYQSWGVAADVAGSYSIPHRLMYFSAAISNFGTTITNYVTGNPEKIPYNIQAGFSKKFLHNPLRISIIAQNLQDLGNLLYQVPDRNSKNLNLETNEPIPEKFTLIDYTLSHLVVNTEVVFSKNFMLRFGYNYLRRRELAIEDPKGFAGFSWGFGIRVSKFHISYGSAAYFLGHSSNLFGITTNFSDFHRAKK